MNDNTKRLLYQFTIIRITEANTIEDRIAADHMTDVERVLILCSAGRMSAKITPKTTF